MSMLSYSILCDTYGDGLLSEPALTAMARRMGHPVDLYVWNEDVRSLYYFNPAVRLVDSPRDGMIKIDHVAAWNAAVAAKAYFAAGFFTVLGVDRQPDDRVHCRIHGLYDVMPAYFADSVVICPFSKCCASHTGLPPNKSAPPEWWEDLVSRLSCHVISLGGKDDPPIEGTLSIRSFPLRSAARHILYAKMAVVMDSWSLHVAGDRVGPTVLMNAANPEWLVRPNDRISVIQASDPRDWDKDLLASKICQVVSCLNPTGTV